jgi:hypothetical protein
MEYDTSKFDKQKDIVLVENNAQTIFDHLNELEKENKIYSRRWFWELLQNAKDSVDSNSKVSVKVVLDNNILSFSHTGLPFEQNDILHLIFHGSSKKNLEGKTGRFGTGFMSTHLLSRKVNIIGKLSDETYFKFDLIRHANNVSEQQLNLEKSYSFFCLSNNQNNYSDGIYNTIFTYELSEPNLKTAEDGLNQLQQILPFVLAFNEKIEDIEVINNNEKKFISRGTKEEQVNDNVKIINQEINYNNIINHVVFVKSEKSDIAVLIEKKEDSFSLVNLDDSYPKLFFDFPLFGTERFGCPIIINSTKFDLKGERDGIYLSEDDHNKPTILENKKIITDSLNHLATLIKFLSEKQIKELYNLFKLTSPFEYPWLHKEWIESIYNEKINNLIETKSFKLNLNHLRLNEMIIPYSESINEDSFFKLVTEFIPSKTPNRNDVSEWIIVAQGFSKLQKIKLNNYEFIIDENKLCERIEKKIKLDEIDAILKTETNAHFENSALKWLNTFFELLSKEQTEYLCSKYKIIPNQKKELIKKELSVPYKDNIGNEEIKTVIEKFGWDIKSNLIHPDFVTKEGIFEEYTLDKVLINISNSSDKITDEQLIDLKVRNALIANLKWLIDHKKTQLIKDAYIVVERGQQSNEISYSKRRLFQNNSDKIIAPSLLWSAKFSIYKEIINKKFILIDDFTSKISSDDFNYLHSQDFIFVSPLIIKESPSKNDLKLLVKSPDSYLKLLNEKEEIIENSIEFSDIAYLTRSDDNILSRTADSIRSAKALLRFLLSQVIDNDVFFNQTSEIIVNNETIILNKCLWINRLRDTQWVPLKPIDNEKQNNSERPSVANITELIKDEPDIINSIKTKNASLFFNQLGISVADIMRNSLTNEEDKLKWDMTFSQLLSNGNINPDLAVEMLGDPRLQEVYLKQKKEREQIKANQNIGYLFEAIFKEIFSSEEYKAQGFDIKRTAIGSDFGVIFEQDIVDENGKETIYKIGEVLIELKTTAKNYAEMTTRQAEEATKNIANYVLAVLPLDGYELNQTTIKKHSRFITNISTPLLDRFNEYKSYNEKKKFSNEEQKEVRLSIEDGEVRYQVKSDLWTNNSLNFGEFITWLKSK